MITQNHVGGEGTKRIKATTKVLLLLHARIDLPQAEFGAVLLQLLLSQSCPEQHNKDNKSNQNDRKKTTGHTAKMRENGHDELGTQNWSHKTGHKELVTKKRSHRTRRKK